MTIKTILKLNATIDVDANIKCEQALRGVQPILPVKDSVTMDTILNVDLDRDGNVTCTQTFNPM